MKTTDTKALQKAVSDNGVKKASDTTPPVVLPSIAELYSKDGLPTIHESSLFQVLVNQNPKPEWIRQHPMTKGDYIPIERVEWLLTQIFVDWKVEIKTIQVIANSVVVTVRVYYYNHVKKEWCWQDGVGASPIQTDKGAGAMDWNAVKSDAVMKAAPAAESYAVKDACEKIGKIFGRDLNRKETFNYDSLKDKYAKAFDHE